MTVLPGPASGREASADRLRPRILSLPGVLRQALQELARSAAVAPLSPSDAPIWITGGGMSEGPARYLLASLTERGIAAQYIPLSEFVAPNFTPDRRSESHAAQPMGTLVLFSQGLAPNARFPLLHGRRFRRLILVTAVVPASDRAAPLSARIAAAAGRDGVQVLTLPPPSEEGLLLRVVGPAVGALAAAYLSGVPLATLSAIPEVYAQAAAAAAPTLGRQGGLSPVALVAGGRYMDACFGLRWKLLEGLQLPDPPIWDLLQVAHGPLQSIWRRPHTLILLQRAPVTHETALWEALSSVFGAPQHQLVRLVAGTLPGTLAYFEHDAQLNILLERALREENGRGAADVAGAERIDLIDWPGHGSDGPLYNLAPPPADLVKLDPNVDGTA